MEWDRQNFFSVWAIFCLYTLLTNGKIKILKQRKKHLEMSSLYTCVPKFTIIWCILPEIWNECFFFAILGHFLPFNLPNNLKNQSFEKMPGNIIILHLHTTNDDHMMYGSWDMEPDRQNFLSFQTIFCPFTHVTTQKIKILKTMLNQVKPRFCNF